MLFRSVGDAGITKADAEAFANQVIDRFRNPYLEHQWESISLNYTSKMRMRNLATLERYVQKGIGDNADYMALGFAGYLKAMGGAEPDRLLADWADDLATLGNFLPKVKDYLVQLQQRSVLDNIRLLN